MTAEKFTSIDDYINSFPEDVQERLQSLKKTIAAEIPDVEETIRYNMPTFNMHGDLLSTSRHGKKHISLYPFTDAMAKAFKEAAAYDTSGKGTIQFPLDKPLPLDLVRKIVKMRLEEREEK